MFVCYICIIRLLAEKLDGLSVTQRNQVYTVLDALLQTIQ